MNRTARLARAGRDPDDETWARIAARETSSPDRPWFLVVVTTGIVCKPGCPARTPLRRNVRIVGSVAEAAAAGARPCLRCRPFDPGASNERFAADDGQSPSEVVARVLRRLEQALADAETPPADAELAAELGVSERRLRRVVREVAGVTPRAWLAARRAERLRAGLAAHRPVLDAAMDAGYDSSSAAYEAAASVVGMAPGRYRMGGEGESIRWTATKTSIGWALVAATDRGLCAVKVGDDPDELEAELRAEFRMAAISRDDETLRGVASLVADLAAGHPRPDAASIPLDLAGTAFRRRVWEALRAIPAGETRTYRGLAVSLGVPKAARAVGTACATNPVSLVVPCHRVVGSDGRLHGYRWGLERKQQILDAERAASTEGQPGQGVGSTTPPVDGPAPVATRAETAVAVG